MNKHAFTLVELLVVVSIIAALAATAIALINPISIVNRGTDITRKKDLDDAKKALEQYITDTGCYPQPTQICMEGNNSTNGFCNICTKGQSEKFSYFTKDICDPKQKMNYLYQVETVFVRKVGPILAHYEVVSCPKWFRIYAALDSAYSASEDIWGCHSKGCGAPPNYGYGYLVTSPGAPNDTSVTSSSWHCYLDDCTQCGEYDNCGINTNPCFGRYLYPSKEECCASNDPNSRYCR